jgi:enolase-phosphatase E1
MTRGLLFDIEGTTTDLAFVQGVLFPYSRAHLPSYVRAHAGDPEVRLAVESVLETARIEGQAPRDLEDAIAVLQRWTQADRKHGALKALQGLVWRAGYEGGVLLAHVFDDVPPCLRRWRDRGLILAIFSSGSVLAQRLLFAHTTFGDLTGLFDHYFDTTTGAKNEPASYRAIASGVGLAAAQMAFFSDAPAELDAAREAGMRTLQVLRPGVRPATGHVQVADFVAAEACLALLGQVR